MNPFGDIAQPFVARPGVAEAMKETSLHTQSSGILVRLYESLVLYPKATSQIAKTILSPVTHMRNFVSASIFATANGIIPDGQAIKQAYQALQTPLKGTRQQNDLYEELLELGVVNSNVRLGDLTRLLEDVNFGETMSADKGFRMLLKPLSNLKESPLEYFKRTKMFGELIKTNKNEAHQEVFETIYIFEKGAIISEVLLISSIEPTPWPQLQISFQTFCSCSPYFWPDACATFRSLPLSFLPLPFPGKSIPVR